MKTNFDIPDGYSKKTKAFINDVLIKLEKVNQIDDSTLSAVTMLMTEYEKYLRANVLVMNEGLTTIIRGVVKPNPAIEIGKSAFSIVIQLMKEFGLTPKSKEKINAMRPAKEKSPLDLLFERRLGKNKKRKK